MVITVGQDLLEEKTFNAKDQCINKDVGRNFLSMSRLAVNPVVILGRIWKIFES